MICSCVTSNCALHFSKKAQAPGLGSLFNIYLRRRLELEERRLLLEPKLLLLRLEEEPKLLPLLLRRLEEEPKLLPLLVLEPELLRVEEDPKPLRLLLLIEPLGRLLVVVPKLLPEVPESERLLALLLVLLPALVVVRL